MQILLSSPWHLTTISHSISLDLKKNLGDVLNIT